MDLLQVRDPIVRAARENMAYLVAGYPMATTGDKFENLSALFQGLGICDLLTKADVDGFRENLARSGQARRSYLLRSLAEGNADSQHLAVSRTEAFLDAMTAGSLVLAREIAAISPATWNPDWEYEEDYYFYRFLHRVVAPSITRADPELHDCVERIESALEGAQWPHLGALRALLERDEQAFAESLQSVLLEEVKKFDQKRSVIVASKFLFWPRSFVSIQGLALLRAAELLKLPISQEFAMCPPDARIPISSLSGRDLFRELEEGIARRRSPQEH